MPRKPQQKKKSLLKKCSVCNESESKYKCPKCRAGYCSVACCRVHKSKCPFHTSQDTENKPPSSSHTQAMASTSDSSKSSKYKLPFSLLSVQTCTTSNYQHARKRKNRRSRLVEDEDELEEEDGWKITPAMKEAMRKSEKMRAELTDKGLQTIIHSIVHSEGGWRGRNAALTQVKSQCPSFSQFIDEVLLTTGIISRRDNEDIHNTFVGKDTDGFGEAISAFIGNNHDFVLNPIVKKRKTVQQLQQIIIQNKSSNDSEESDENNSDQSDSEDSSEGSKASLVECSS